ncbi:MAG: tRNA (adenosine(37)-N6)-threonylcarbamoyltransferase complex ATPase subunit type 1 TsaE [Cyclobacteriaceae bacterium]
MKFVVHTVSDLRPVSEAIKKKTESYKIICLDGDLGAGKTTLVKDLGEALGVSDRISSPTFSLINEYEDADRKPVYHFDFYRLKDEEEALDIGIEEYLYSGNLCIIEWASMFPDLIPAKHLEININLVGERNREITLVEHG